MAIWSWGSCQVGSAGVFAKSFCKNKSQVVIDCSQECHMKSHWWMQSHVALSCVSSKISGPNWSQGMLNQKSCCSLFLVIQITICITFILFSTHAWCQQASEHWTSHNLLKSVETPTSGDHVEHENSLFFPSSSFPSHPWEVQFIPQCTAFSFPWWMAISLPWQAASSPDEQSPPRC